MTVSNIVFAVFSGIGIVISLVPLYWHLESWYIGTCMFTIWTALGCLVHFVNSILWNGNAINRAPVWCDIASRIEVGVAVAWPACNLCIIRRLYLIASSTSVTTTRAQKRREMIIDLLITIGIPVLQMLVELIVSGHRFNIYENWGCGQATWNTYLAYALVWSWPLVLAVISAIYGILAIRIFMKKRKHIRGFSTTKGNPTYDRYWRLTLLAVLILGFTFPLAIWGIVGNIMWGEVSPWVSWADTHWGYSRVFQFPAIVLDQHPGIVISLETTRWAAVLCAFTFFGFFGFADETKKNYRLLACTITKRFGHTTPTGSAAIPNSMISPGTAPKGGISFPVLVAQRTDLTMDSFDSCSDKRSSSSSVIYPTEGDPRIPEFALDPASVRRPPVLAIPKPVYLGNATDKV